MSFSEMTFALARGEPAAPARRVGAEEPGELQVQAGEGATIQEAAALGETDRTVELVDRGPVEPEGRARASLRRPAQL